MHININIDNLTEDELLALNRRVIARLNLIQQHSTLNSMIKFNPKTVVVLTDDGQRWKVSPQLLRHLIENNPSGKVTTLRRVERDSP